MKEILFVFSLLAIYTTGIAQTPDSSATEKLDSSHFKASLTYLTNNVWQGRKDDEILPYLTPTITYTHKSGLYADVGVGIVPYNGAGFDLVMLEGGYDKDLGKRFSLSLYGGKYFYATKSNSVRSASGGSASAGLSYTPENDLFSLTETGGLNFADKTDYASTTELQHHFYLGSDGQYSISPEVAVNAGTQNYYSSYIEDIPVKRKKNGATVTRNYAVMNASKFQVLDYELSCPLEYDAKKWGLTVTPYYAIAKGPVSYRTMPGNRLITENLTNSFYTQVAAFVKF